MSKVYYFITFTIGLTILMRLAGVPYAGESQIINWLGLDPSGMYVKTSTFYLALIVVFGIAAAVGAVLSNKEAAIRAGIATGIMGIGIGTFIGILQTINSLTSGTSDSWIFSIVFLLFSVYIVGFIFAMIEWWSTGQ